jgi:hypothetical protein
LIQLDIRSGIQLAERSSMLVFGTEILSFVLALLVSAQDANNRKKFAGTWEAKIKDKVVCTITVETGDSISGAIRQCSIHVDNDGDLADIDPLMQMSPPRFSIRGFRETCSRSSRRTKAMMRQRHSSCG